MALPKKLTWKPKTKDQRGPEWKPRKCKCCKLTYVPMDSNPANAKRSKFCNRKCKDGYHRNGGMSLPRLQEVVIRATVKALLADDAFLATLADKLRVKQSPSIEAQEIQKAIRIRSVNDCTDFVRTALSPAGRSGSQRSA
jgi:hypothetical protein